MKGAASRCDTSNHERVRWRHQAIYPPQPKLRRAPLACRLVDFPACWLTPLEGTKLRIVKGKFAGRTLTSPNDFRVRPTAEHVRVALLSMVHDELANARVLDLFAGTGALGLEAISRGAKSADFVETRPASLHALKANVAALRGMKDCTRIFKRDALPFAAALVADSYDITFVDPPYGSKMLDRVLESWMANKFSRVIAIEHAASHELPRPFDKRIIEDSAVSLYRA